ncbi:antirestriction protein ArdA [Hasllibacter sp. MH4015]|uniref:antirestriction protein ArdA n=1 Tax=Hasllibacter sp. MH4015 TaxID=2854029 RepID=UPI001CD46963|nr:antirestriction protein ArdA [Hasllibacter sp. MH4015]
MTRIYAQPYDLSATGFFFESAEEYHAKVSALRNDYGQEVEEFELQFIDGEAIDAALAEATGLYQGSIEGFFEAVEEWAKKQKQRVIVAVGECGYSFEYGKTSPDDFDVDIYHLASMRTLAIEFVEEGLMGDISEAMRIYFDYDALARDLSVDYTETIIAGECLIYRCG